MFSWSSTYSNQVKKFTIPGRVYNVKYRLSEVTFGTSQSLSIGVTIVGQIRSNGGDVIPSPTKNNSNHATLIGVSAETASSLFEIPQNPAK